MKGIEVRSQNCNGFTLMELILAITLISIVALAAFSGFQFAYYTFSSAGEFSKTTYDYQQDFENNLTLVYQLPTTSKAADLNSLASVIGTGSDEVIDFTWSGTSTKPTDFKVVGVTLTQTTSGGKYLEAPINIFVPIYTEP